MIKFIPTPINKEKTHTYYIVGKLFKPTTRFFCLMGVRDLVKNEVMTIATPFKNIVSFLIYEMSLKSQMIIWIS